MKRNIGILRLRHVCKMTLPLIILFFSASLWVHAQTWQNILNANRDESYTSGMAVAGKYYAFGNTKSFSTPTGRINRLLFSSFTGNGQATFKAILDISNDTVYNASDMQAGYQQFTATNNNEPVIGCNGNVCNTIANTLYPCKTTDDDNYFFMTGWFTVPPSLNAKMFVMKTRNDGSVVWSKTGFFSDAAGVESETGVSVESCPNGDVVVVSKAVDSTTGLIFPIVTRLDNKGKLVWRYSYRDDGSSPGGIISFEPEQSVIFNEDLFGANNLSNPVGIAVTGQSITTAGTHLFAMRIGYNGALLWRKIYKTVNEQVGFDIMCEDKSLGADALHSEHFIITGLNDPNRTDTSKNNKTIIASINTETGAFDKAWLIKATNPSYDLGIYAQSIYQSLSAADKVILSGGVYKTSITQDVFISEFDLSAATVTFTNTFPLTRPNFLKTETVYATDASFSAAEQGYFLATNNINLPVKPSGTNAQGIKTDLSGQVNNSECTTEAQTVTVSSLGMNVSDVCTVLDCYKMKKIFLQKIDTAFTPFLCIEANNLPKANKPANAYADKLKWEIYPNPVKEKVISIQISSEENTPVVFMLTDAYGNIAAKQNNLLNKGKNTHRFSLNNIRTGIYKMSCIIDGNINSKTVFVE